MHHIQDPENILLKLSAVYTEGGTLNMVGVRNEDSTVCRRPHTSPNQGQDCAVVRIMPGATVALHGCDKPGPAQVVKKYLNNSNDFTTTQSVDNIIVAAKDKCTHDWILDYKDIGVNKNYGEKRGFGTCCGSH